MKLDDPSIPLSDRIFEAYNRCLNSRENGQSYNLYGLLTMSRQLAANPGDEATEQMQSDLFGIVADYEDKWEIRDQERAQVNSLYGAQQFERYFPEECNPLSLAEELGIEDNELGEQPITIYSPKN